MHTESVRLTGALSRETIVTTLTAVHWDEDGTLNVDRVLDCLLVVHGDWGHIQTRVRMLDGTEQKLPQQKKYTRTNIVNIKHNCGYLNGD